MLEGSNHRRAHARAYTILRGDFARSYVNQTRNVSLGATFAFVFQVTIGQEAWIFLGTNEFFEMHQLTEIAYRWRTAYESRNVFVSFGCVHQEAVVTGMTRYILLGSYATGFSCPVHGLGFEVLG